MKKDVQIKSSSSIYAIQKFSDFYANNHHAFLVRKAERLASALYVITGFIQPSDPLRERLRTLALELISRSSDSVSFHAGGADVFASRCAEIGALLETAQSAGLISHMNASLICDEYASLASFAKENKAKILDQGDTLERSEVSPSVKESALKSKTNVFLKIKDYKRVSEISSKRRSDRKTKILSLIDRKGKISIKDAVSVISECSEKTIQRDILSLVSEGVLYKEGERRWSVYGRKIQRGSNAVVPRAMPLGGESPDSKSNELP